MLRFDKLHSHFSATDLDALQDDLAEERERRISRDSAGDVYAGDVANPHLCSKVPMMHQSLWHS